MNVLTTALSSEHVAYSVGSVLTLIGFYLGMDDPQWNRKFGVRLAEHQTLDKLDRNYYKSRPGKGIYDLVSNLSLGVNVEKWDYRLFLRCQKILNLTPEQRKDGRTLAHEWIATVGVFSRFAAEVEGVALRRFLQTYHLGIIREGSVAVPFVVDLMAHDLLSSEEAVDAAWGLALVKQALLYNSMARQQRQPVYFAETQNQPLSGPVAGAPSKWQGRAYNVLDRLYVRMRLRKRQYRRALRQLKGMSNQMRRSFTDY